MMIIGVDNTFHLGSETIALLKRVADKNQIAYIHLKVLESKVYKSMMLKQNIDVIQKNEKFKLCIIEFTKKTLKSLKAIQFDSIVFFDEKIGDRKCYNHHTYFMKNKLQKICEIKNFIIPDTIRGQLNKDISYGWSKQAIFHLQVVKKK